MAMEGFGAEAEMAEVWEVAKVAEMEEAVTTVVEKWVPAAKVVASPVAKVEVKAWERVVSTEAVQVEAVAVAKAEVTVGKEVTAVVAFLVMVVRTATATPAVA